jgi:hypothetical protein
MLTVDCQCHNGACQNMACSVKSQRETCRDCIEHFIDANACDAALDAEAEEIINITENAR